jgi:RNA polymerase sigma-70 factor, ECF subfamily
MGEHPHEDTSAVDELLPRVAAGDAGAFTALFRRRSGQVYRFAFHMTGSASVAEDVTQDVFLAVMRNAGRYVPGVSSEIAWLCGIARNHVRRCLQRERPTVALADDGADGAGIVGHASGTPDPLQEMMRVERIEALRRAVSALPVRYREVVVLCDLQELSYADAAAALDCALGTVRSRLSRGRALLASKLGIAGDGGEDGVDLVPGKKAQARWAI